MEQVEGGVEDTGFLSKEMDELVGGMSKTSYWSSCDEEIDLGFPVSLIVLKGKEHLGCSLRVTHVSKILSS